MTVKSVNFISNNITIPGPINVTSLPHSSISLGYSLLVLNFNQLVPKGMHITQKRRILFWEKEEEREKNIMPQFLLYYWWSIYNSLYNQIIMWTVFPIPPIYVFWEFQSVRRAVKFETDNKLYTVLVSYKTSGVERSNSWLNFIAETIHDCSRIRKLVRINQIITTKRLKSNRNKRIVYEINTSQGHWP